jgi:chemotaxis protein CheY-P-specific phosphatase CheC
MNQMIGSSAHYVDQVFYEIDISPPRLIQNFDSSDPYGDLSQTRIG